MPALAFADETYAVDADEYLSDFNAWDENFARAMAPKAGIIESSAG
jgi:sulfur relay (sulfurtransferase) DsrC/TusE family protein